MSKQSVHSRRHLLGTLGAAAGSLLFAQAWALPAGHLASGRLIVVFLRGAYDGLSATVPYADPDYRRQRPSIAIPAPDGSPASALRLDQTFALHPALAPLLPLWHQGVLGFIPAAGSPDPTRSHFEAQTHWEIGMPGQSHAPRGWLNALAALGSGGADAQQLAIGVGEANPKILSGPSSVRLVPRGHSATQQGVLANARTRQALMDMYAGADPVSSAFRQGAQSRMASAQELSRQALADNGAADATGLLLDAQHIGTLMRNDRTLRLGFLSAGGWDTHAAQGATSGALALNLGKLAQALVQLRRDFSQSGDTIVVASEFGRTCAENGTGGTDHGHGNTLWLIGNNIHGGRWHGLWSGLAQGKLHEGRDLPVHHDFRAIFAQVLRANFGLRDRQLQDVFPGAAFDARLAGLVKVG